MKNLYLSKDAFPAAIFDPTVDYIRSVQLPTGAIPWEKGGKLDPWDHTEAAMGLSIGGAWEEAVHAYQWLADNQMGDGSWWAEYRGQVVADDTRKESNFCAYVATGVWHHYLVTGDRNFLIRFYPMVERAIDFVVSLQSEHGDIPWAAGPDGVPAKDALVTACSSIYKSLECAALCARELDEPRHDWLDARARLGDALRTKPERFDRTWKSKDRYSMDWFYPILTGVITGEGAKARIARHWDTFVEDGLGSRCVSDEPWVTFAESCELVLALLAAGMRGRAAEVYSWLHQWRGEDGAYPTGWQFDLEILWPDEQPTWTAGAILLAADALTHHTKAAELFTTVTLLDDGADDADLLEEA
ncbi:MAG: prenyltransferase [Alphaproteobacteria bacterium]